MRFTHNDDDRYNISETKGNDREPGSWGKNSLFYLQEFYLKLIYLKLIILIKNLIYLSDFFFYYYTFDENWAYKN